MLLQISSLANSIRVLAKMEEPVGRVLKRTEVWRNGFSDTNLDHLYFDWVNIWMNSGDT